MGTDEAATKAWAAQALEKMRLSGGAGLLEWLRQEQAGRRGKIREALGELINYVDPRTMLMDYARYRASGFQIGTGMMESTCNQLVGMRLKGPGMHWTEQGAIAITALRGTSTRIGTSSGEPSNSRHGTRPMTRYTPGPGTARTAANPCRHRPRRLS